MDEDEDEDEDTWLSDKTQKIIEALADIAAYRNGIPNYREEDENGFPNREDGLSTALHRAVHTATTILAAELDVAWQAIDRDRILRHGQVGYNQLLVRYGLATPQPTVASPRDNDPYQPKPLGLLDDVKTTWTFANFDVARPVHGAVTWEERVVDEGRQRELLYRALEETSQYAAQPQGWLLIAGPYGAGKSHLAGAIIRRAVARGLAPLYLSALTIAYRYRSLNDPDWMAEQVRLEAADLLVLDDLFLDERMVWNRYIEQLLRARHRQARPTVLVSTRPREHLPLWLSNAVTEISVITSSYRRLPKKQS
jgi:IstB-like ATP binding protein